MAGVLVSAGGDRVRQIDAGPSVIRRAIGLADLGDEARRDAGVARRRVQLLVSEQGHAIMSIFLCH